MKRPWYLLQSCERCSILQGNSKETGIENGVDGNKSRISNDHGDRCEKIGKVSAGVKCEVDS